jgi:transcriptional regulator with XRE-family HTH domain
MIGQTIREARKRKALSQDEAAAIAGISPQTLRRYEAGTSGKPHAVILRSVALALDLDPDALLAASRQEHAPNPAPSHGEVLAPQ